MMVYSESISSEDTANRTTYGVTLLVARVLKVVHCCNNAKETQILNISSCSLVQVPEAVFHLMKSSDILTCNLSGNNITKITPQFSICFNLLKTLNLSSNQLSSLPSELVHCNQLHSVDISINSFVVFPSVLLEIESVTEIRANKNFLAEVDDEALEQHKNLELINLEENPLDPITHARLSRVKGLRIVLTDRRVQEWEDLNI